MRRSITMSAVAALGLALAGCGGGKADNSEAATTGSEEVASATNADFDPCSVLSTEEVAAITTDTVQETKRDDDTCYYKSKPDTELRLMILKTGGEKQMAATHRAADVLGGMGAAVADKGGAGADAAQILKKDETATPKLGDESAWGVASTLTVRKGDMLVEVLPPMMHDPATHPGYPLVPTAEKRKIAIAVAQKVLAKLN